MSTPDNDSTSGDAPNSMALSASSYQRRGRVNGLTIAFILFMALVGVGILITRLDSGSGGSNNRNTQVAFAPTSTGGKVGFATATPQPEIKIYVTGEVNNPGIYTMQKDDRINDALEAAGGTTDQADISQFDLAQRVRDEMHINVPKLPPTPTHLINPTNSTNSTNAVVPGLNPTVTNSTPAVVNNSSSNTVVSLPNQPNQPTASKAGSSATQVNNNSGKIGPESGVKININTADATELERLPGVGPTLSQRLVEYRTQHGPFHTLDDLRRVQGFTRTVTDKIKDLIVF